MTELATNTSTADTIIGSHSSDSSVIKPPQRLSGWFIVAADSLRVQPSPATRERHTRRSEIRWAIHLRDYLVTRPTGQETPVPPSPQYPPGFFDRYCWW